MIRKILKKEFDDLDNKKLKGYKDIFRVRKGKIRIIYQVIGNKMIILVINKRKDDIYKIK